MHESFFEAKLMLFTSTGIILLLAAVIVAALFITQKRKFRHKKQLYDMQNLYEKTMLQTELKIQEQLFKAISQNLHDNVGSNISTAMLLLYKDEAMTKEEIESNRKEALIMLGNVVDDLKHIARGLNPDFLHEIGLCEAIRLRIMQLEKTNRYQIRLFLPELKKILDPQKQLILYYIFQEAINNIITHAKAKSLSVKLEYFPNELMLAITDDGRGIAEMHNEDSHANRGSGLITMKHHAAVIGGELNIESLPGQGTAILITVPDPYYQP